MTIPVRRDPASADFFDAAARGELLLVRDRTTGEWFGPETDPRLEPGRYETAPASGRGTVVSFAVVHERDDAGRPVRTVVGVVELAEGPWWWTRLEGADPDADLIGLPVEVICVKSGPEAEDEYLPRFRPVAG